MIVCTIQKLGLALDQSDARTNYRQLLAPLREERMAFIFDECHRSQFGVTHQAIREFFPRAQLFGFTGTPIFEENSSYRRVEGEVETLRTTEDLFQQQLHQYTITHAIDDGNVLRFHVDFYRPEGGEALVRDDARARREVVETILNKHDVATGGRRFNALLATASINDAIAYYRLFAEMQAERRLVDPASLPLNVAAVFSPPGDVSAEVRQIQEDLPQEQQDNRRDPETKKAALREIIGDYNSRFGTAHKIEEFDAYYQDVQKRIKDQQFPNADLPMKGREKVDITIVVDMLLTGFDSKYLNTLYVDKNLKQHGLIQAFSRTNRVLNDTKPYGNVLDFRGQQSEVDAAIALFSGAHADRAREIWLVEAAPVVIDQLRDAKVRLDAFMKSQGLSGAPEDLSNLKGDDARIGFVKHFKEVQRLQSRLDQYTDLTDEQAEMIERILPENDRNALRGIYLETAERLRAQQQGPRETRSADVDQLDFDLVLFASAMVDYDYIMRLIADFSMQAPGKATMNREELIGLIAGDAKFMDERDAITEYVRGLEAGRGLDEEAIRAGYEGFKEEREERKLAEIAERHGVAGVALGALVDNVLARRIFDGERLTELLAPLGLGWKKRARKELALMRDLVPLLKRRAGGREISGLRAYEE